jgi:hypothetical protein
MKIVCRKLIWKQEVIILLKRATRIHFLMETKERGNSKELERRMLQYRKREKISHVNTVQNMAMMKNNVGNFILK